MLIQLGLPQVLPYYTPENLVAKFLMAHLYDTVPPYYHKFTLLSDSEVSVIVNVLTTCITNDTSTIRLEVKGVGTTIDECNMLECICKCSEYPSNLKMLGESLEFLKLLALLLSNHNSETITPSLKLLNSLCSNHSTTKLIMDIFPDVLSQLEELAFHSDEEVQSLVAAVIPTILSNESTESKICFLRYFFILFLSFSSLTPQAFCPTH